MKIHLATDHAGLELKNNIQEFLISKKFDVISGPLHLIACTPKNLDDSSAVRWSIETKKYLLKNNFMLSRPHHNGRYYLKAVMGNPHTTKIYIEQLVDLLNRSIGLIK